MYVKKKFDSFQFQSLFRVGRTPIHSKPKYNNRPFVVISGQWCVVSSLFYANTDNVFLALKKIWRALKFLSESSSYTFVYGSTVKDYLPEKYWLGSNQKIGKTDWSNIKTQWANISKNPIKVFQWKMDKKINDVSVYESLITKMFEVEVKYVESQWRKTFTWIIWR